MAVLTTTTDDASVIDGWIQQNGGVNTWAALREGAGSSHSVTDGGGNGLWLGASTTTNRWSYLRRFPILFNTTTIPASAIITSATISIYGSGYSNNFSLSVDCVTSNPASNTDLANGDFTSFGTTLLATSIALSAWNNSNWNVFTLNATGIANITKAGISKFGLRLSADTTNTEPAWSSGVNGYADFLFRGSAHPPTLTVTYSLPSGGAFLLNFI